MSRDTLTRILDLARWAPSGDNTQPWRFELVDDRRIRVFGSDTRDHILYDFDGHPSHIAHGALLETIRIAATNFGFASHWVAHSERHDRNPIYDVQFSERPSVAKDPLFEYIESRTVQRRPMKTIPLTAPQRNALIAAAGDEFHVQLFETPAERRKIAGLLWKSAKIRLTCPEAYPVHKEIIEWRARFSKDRIPEQAVGVDPATARLMEWVMQSWGRVEFFNRYLMGTIAPRIQLDLLPAIFCAAHLLIRPKKSPAQLQDWVRLGTTWQRIWLTAAQQGLHFQPEMTPVIFRWYARAGRPFSADAGLFDQAIALSADFERISGSKQDDPFGFLARVGTSKTPTSRSIRLDLVDLIR